MEDRVLGQRTGCVILVHTGRCAFAQIHGSPKRPARGKRRTGASNNVLIRVILCNIWAALKQEVNARDTTRVHCIFCSISLST